MEPCPFCAIVRRESEQTDEGVYADEAAVAFMRIAHAIRRALAPVGLNLRQNSGPRAGQDVLHFHLHLVPRYENDTVLPGCVWGVPPWQPPPGGAAERKRVAALIRGELGVGVFGR